MQPALFTLTDWRHAYRDGAEPADLLGARLRHLREQHAAHAWIHLADEGQLRAQLDALAALAAAHDDRESAMRALPLFGVPFAVKDNIDIADVTTTAACPAFAHTAPRSATVVRKLQAAGAVWLGKTNLDQFATGLVGTRSPYGRPSSAFGGGRISGGSSSGSAVTVSCGEVAFSLGTDTAGSGRVPAGFNNIVGLKPTPGRVSTTGVVPACRSLDCVSIFALDVADAAEVLAVIEGPDGDDAYSHFAPGPASLPPQLRIGVPAQPLFSGDAGYAASFANAINRAKELGHTIRPIDFAPLYDTADLLYNGPWVAERHVAVEALLDSDPGAFDLQVRHVIEAARRFDATDAFRGQYKLREAQARSAALWTQVDVLMVPTAPGHPRTAEVDADPLGSNAQLGTYTNFVNLLGWSALALPSAFTAIGLPFGVTFIAPAGYDAALACFGLDWQRSVHMPFGAVRAGRPAHVAPLSRWPAVEPSMPIAVVGAHLSGLPLNWQLTERGARWRETTLTAPAYRLHALPGTVPPKPGLQRVNENGCDIVVEVWDMPLREVGSFLALIPAPLGLGTIELASGEKVHGFLCEAHALQGAPDVSVFGGWRAYVDSLKGTS